jgi:RNA polymerase subunit RPABC4/transcription elongation factor Spt4
MAECEKCGEDLKGDPEICPACGFNPGTQTITDLPKTKIRRRKRKEDLGVPKKERGEVCVNCRTEIPGNINLCPKCGLNPGVQTITDIGKWKGKPKGD